GAFLFPHQVMPLHVFEPRYREMVEDLLDSPGRLVIGTQLEGERETAEHPPAVLPVAGLGEILRHESLPDRRFHIWVLGLTRVRIEEQPSDRPYRQVLCKPFVEIETAVAEESVLARRLHRATAARLKEPLPLPDSAPTSLLADLLLQTLGAPQSVVERVFSEPSVSTRARLVLRAASRVARPHGDDA
ncbi:MAG TPA: LON peptidase substrate-binding domain-containing protein, partial [Planctomycetota bacterium]|nr:LON peptidase substrate-binding domain-containing protein [Planctomycetota bacterium]